MFGMWEKRSSFGVLCEILSEKLSRSLCNKSLKMSLGLCMDTLLFYLILLNMSCFSAVH